MKVDRFQLDGWFNVFFTRDIFDDTLTFADAHLSILWRSISLSLITTVTTLFFGFPTAYFIATRPQHQRDTWLFVVTIPFWTNILIRTFAMQEVLRNEGIFNSALRAVHVIDSPIQIMFTNWAVLFGMVYVYLPLLSAALCQQDKIDFRWAAGLN